MVLAPVSKSSRLNELDPMRSNAAKRLHGQFIKATCQELLEGVNVANIEGVRLFGDHLNSGFDIIGVSVVDDSLAGLVQVLSDRPGSLKTLRLE